MSDDAVSHEDFSGKVFAAAQEYRKAVIAHRAASEHHRQLTQERASAEREMEVLADTVNAAHRALLKAIEEA